jgi:hypothetical protein
MPDGREAAPQARSTDPFMGTIVLVLVALLAAVIALALGLTWKDLLHWTGELLLIIGIALAAVGISDVRSEWTRLPGIGGRVQQAAQTIQARAASFMWAHWNRVVERWPRLAKWLHLRTHLTHVRWGDAGVAADTLIAAASFPPVRVVASGDFTVEQRLDQLEGRMREAQEQIRNLNAQQEQQARVWQAATEKERAARRAEDQRIRNSIANLAGGGLKLQAWGVACLLVGTVMTAIW